MIEEQLLELSQLDESPGGDALDAAVREVEADQLGDHLEGVGLDLLQRIVVEVQFAEVRDV